MKEQIKDAIFTIVFWGEKIKITIFFLRGLEIVSGPNQRAIMLELPGKQRNEKISIKYI